MAKGAYPGLRSVNEIPSLGYNGAFQGRESINYAKGVSIGDSDYGQIWVNSSGRLFAQFSNNNGAKQGGECVYMDDITSIEQKANNAVPSSRKVNGKALTRDISLSAGDVGAFNGFIFVNSIPTRSYVGAWGGSGNGSSGWVKGLNIGTAGSDVGQLYIDPDGNLYAYFLNNHDFTRGGAVNTHPVGSPIPWPLPNAPTGYFTCNGQSFNKSIYPQLAVAYPSGKLPDLRGEFIRGWDDGRGVDSGRGILSWQADEFKSHSHSYQTINEPGTGRASGAGAGFQTFETNKTGGNETRPRNIAFNYIVRAA
ncbi:MULTISPECIES: phage tail protein [Photorhabdus]|uniref:Phage-related tail fiber protein n=1 Tax=Photorhabdus temperata subsp. temperata Meg1 TaxID=1393735 RepID=A0A081RUW9_PHOTE|nr:phage tail protein [Photorhabdus temperata]KER02472.1 phage-related tail fiber protein [Photorhabdus temperata subsp. temperata Meg1]